MSDNRLRPQDRKRTLIAPLVIGGVIAALLAAAFLLQHRPVPTPAAPIVPPSPAEPAPTQAPNVPKETAPLSRRDLVDAVNSAAANYAAGQNSDETAKALVGRRFSLTLPFGCDGPQVSGGASQAYYEFDPEKRTVKLVARPGDWTGLPIMESLNASGETEKVEGFWLPRPWSYAETCPPKRDQPVPASPTPVAGQSLGLARLFEKAGSRLLRRDGRAYEFVRKLADGDGAPQPGTYQLVLEGRIGGFQADRPIACWAETSDHRPVCLIAVEFDRVAFEDAAGKLLAEWRE